MWSGIESNNSKKSLREENNNMNKVVQGDCLELMKDIPDGSVDMILADLPYGTTACKWDTIIPFEPLWEHYKRIIKPNGAIVLFGSEPFSSALRMSNIKQYKYDWVWIKNRPTGSLHSKNRPMSKFENICVFSPAPMGHFSQLGNSRMEYNPQGVSESGVEKTVKEKGFHGNHIGARPNQVGNKYIAKSGYPNNILNFNKEENHIHPTQKPVALFEYLIETYTNEGDLVLDNVAGSGTTGVAAMNLNRNFILMEQEPEYVEIIKQRLANEQA